LRLQLAPWTFSFLFFSPLPPPRVHSESPLMPISLTRLTCHFRKFFFSRKDLFFFYPEPLHSLKFFLPTPGGFDEFLPIFHYCLMPCFPFPFWHWGALRFTPFRGDISLFLIFFGPNLFFFDGPFHLRLMPFPRKHAFLVQSRPLFFAICFSPSSRLHPYIKSFPPSLFAVSGLMSPFDGTIRFFRPMHCAYPSQKWRAAASVFFGYPNYHVFLAGFFPTLPFCDLSLLTERRVRFTSLSQSCANGSFPSWPDLRTPLCAR